MNDLNRAYQIDRLDLSRDAPVGTGSKCGYHQFVIVIWGQN